MSMRNENNILNPPNLSFVGCATYFKTCSRLPLMPRKSLATSNLEFRRATDIADPKMNRAFHRQESYFCVSSHIISYSFVGPLTEAVNIFPTRIFSSDLKGVVDIVLRVAAPKPPISLAPLALGYSLLRIFRGSR